MISQTNQQATFQILDVVVQAGGSGVAVWRDYGNAGTLLVATAYHVVGDHTTFQLMDHQHHVYNDVRVVIADKTYDFALLEVKNVPLDIPCARVRHPSVILTDGVPAYTIGWPKLMDMHSVSSGDIRSASWTLNGVTQNILISVPIFGGNSGGGVFLTDSHECIGVVSWAVMEQETLNGVVPFTVLYEAILYYMFRPSVGLTAPSRVHREAYFMGMLGYLNDAFFYEEIKARHVALNGVGVAGVLVQNVVPNSPAAVAGWKNFDRTTMTGVVVWALAPKGTTNWRLIQEELPIDVALAQIAQPTALDARPWRNQRSAGEDDLKAYDVVLPDTLTVEVLVSGILNGRHDATFKTHTMVLGKREAFYNAYGNVDPSQDLFVVFV